MFNKIILAGNLSKDIELRYTQSNTAIANTALAVNRKYKGQDGTQKEEVLFIDITFYGRTAEVANQYLHKGSKIMIDGRLKLEQWTDNQGQKRSKHKVDVESLQMLDGKESGSSSEKPNSSQAQAQSRPPQQHAPSHHPAPAQRPQQPTPEFPEMSDEIPF